MRIDLNEILSPEGLNSLMFGDPYAKLCFTSLLVKSALPYYQSKKLEKSSLRYEQEKQNQDAQGKKKRLYIWTATPCLRPTYRQDFCSICQTGILLQQT